MPLMQWCPDMSVGVEDLDADHRRLVALLNEAHDAILAGTAGTLLAPALDRLAAYCRDHFAREEALMEACGFPELAAHRAEHAELASRVHGLRDRLLGGSVENLNMELLVLFKTWLTSHIRVSDARYKPYLRRSGLARS